MPRDHLCFCCNTEVRQVPDFPWKTKPLKSISPTPWVPVEGNGKQILTKIFAAANTLGDNRGILGGEGNSFNNIYKFVRDVHPKTTLSVMSDLRVWKRKLEAPSKQSKHASLGIAISTCPHLLIPY